MRGTLLVVDDDEASCRLVRAIFSAEGLDVLAASDGPSGIERVRRDQPDLVLLDLHLPGMSGLEVLETLRTQSPTIPVVMLTGSRDVRDAVRAIQIGAVDYLTKPTNHDEVVAVVHRALETRSLRLEVEALRHQTVNDKRESLAAQMGSSPAIARIVDQVATVAASDFTVLILGETGTGKELVSQALHEMSDRRRKPFVALDCGAIPEHLLESELFGHERGAFTGAERRKEGRFRLAEGGTCLLDEVGNMPMSLQAKLLRVLESKQLQPIGADRASPMDVRFVAATNHDLQDRVRQGAFRADLYFRLAQYTIVLPPLRQRKEDIDVLSRRFMTQASVELRRPIQAIVPEALELLRQHSWPGNVRELRNVVRQAVLETKEVVIRADGIRTAMARNDGGATMPGPAKHVADESLKEIASRAASMAERQAICDTLRATAGNKSQAARALKTDYKTLHVKMKLLGIEAPDFSQ